MSLSKGKTTTFVSVNIPYNDLFLQSISTDRKSEWVRTKTNGNVRFGRIFCFSFIADVVRICNCYTWSLIQKHPVLSCPETKLVWLQKSLIHFITSRICWKYVEKQQQRKTKSKMEIENAKYLRENLGHYFKLTIIIAIVYSICL